MTGTIFILLVLLIPSCICLLWWLTPSGRRWLKKNHMI